MVEQLSIAEFERLLSRGRGKAILHLQQHDAAPYRDVIRRCCLTDTIYDPRCESNQSYYLTDVIELSGIADALCEMAIQDLHTNGNFEHLFPLLGQLAQRGFTMARQAMYAWCRLHYDPQQGRLDTVEPLLELDGVQAFLFLLDPRQSGRYPDVHNQRFNGFGYTLSKLEESLGEAEVLRAIQQATEGYSSLRETIDDIYAQRAADYIELDLLQARGPTKDQQDIQNQIALPYAELRNLLDKGELEENRVYHLLPTWSRNASDADFRAAAVDFNTRPMSLSLRLKYANMFTERAFPLDDLNELFRLRDLVEDDGDLEQYQLYIFLPICKEISHPRIRALALDMIMCRRDAGEGVALLANNFEDGDWALIESLFEADLDEHDYHSLGFSIRDVFKKHPSLDAVPALIRMFDANRCSRCREDVVESLVSLNALPDWMADECRYDANLDLRAYAERGFTNASDD